jgi:hypothetical protein
VLLPSLDQAGRDTSRCVRVCLARTHRLPLQSAFNTFTSLYTPHHHTIDHVNGRTGSINETSILACRHLDPLGPVDTRSTRGSMRPSDVIVFTPWHTLRSAAHYKCLPIRHVSRLPTLSHSSVRCGVNLGLPEEIALSSPRPRQSLSSIVHHCLLTLASNAKLHSAQSPPMAPCLSYRCESSPTSYTLVALVLTLRASTSL